jgi:hypothetical protein
MDILTVLNSRTEIFHLRELDRGKPYEILTVEKVASKFGGSQLLLKIRYNENTFGLVYLPERFAKKVSDDQLKDIVGLKIVYNGEQKFNGRSCHCVEFEK